MKKYLLLILGIFLYSFSIIAQTNPSAQNIPYTFTSMTGALPAGMAIHRFGTSTGSIPTSRLVTPGNGDLPFGSAGNSGGWHNHGADGVGLLASGSQAAGAIVVAINTLGKSNIEVSWLCRTMLQQASRDNSIALQYRVGTSGNYINVGTASTYSSAGNADGHASPIFSETLPSGAENQAVVQIRWIYWESAGSAGSRDKIAIDQITIGEAVPMPVRWLGLSALTFGKAVNIKWSTAEEKNNSMFEVERSNDGINFALIGKKQPLQQLTSNNIYHLVDATPDKGINYYRIKQIDLNGNFSYSQIVTTLFENQPLTLHNFGLLSLKATGIKRIALLEIFDASGRKVITRQLENEEKLDLTSLNRGMYFCTLSEDGYRIVLKIIK